MIQEFATAAGLKKLQVVANQRCARNNTSVPGQVPKLTTAKPDAVLIAGSGTPAALPAKALKERNYTGRIDQTHGVANADFLRVDGKDMFGAHAWDAGLLMGAAIPVALKKAQPGTPEFRAALRDALEQVKELPGAHGIFNLSATDHLGLDQRARVMVLIENGAWKYKP